MGLPAYVDGFQAIVADVCVLQDVDFCMLQLTSKLKDTYKDYMAVKLITLMQQINCGQKFQCYQKLMPYLLSCFSVSCGLVA